MCQPCYIGYNFIGHYETLYSDADAVLAKLNSGRNESLKTTVKIFPRSDPNNEWHEGSGSLMNKYYSQIPTSDIRELYKVFSLDYELFGYEHPYVA